MTIRDDPFADEPNPEVEEISDDLIIAPGETLPGAVAAPGAEPSETSNTVSGTAIPAAPSEPTPKARAATPAAQPRPVARLTPSKPIARQNAIAAPELQTEPPRLDEASTRVVIVPRETAPRRRASPLLALFLLLCGLGGGFFAGRLWERHGGLAGLARLVAPPPAPVAAPAAPAPTEAGDDGDRPVAAKPKRAAKPPAKAPAPAKAARAAPATGAKGKLAVTAPAAAEIFLDGKRIGKGSTRVDVAPGRHRIEVRLGKSRVSETFESEPGVTWTYDVTPTQK
jgi:hypothetical protein